MGTPADPNAPCLVCDAHEVIMHSHHTIPRSRGGDDSLQIPLCPTCHNALHANALAVVARINSGKKRARALYWRTPEEELRAKPYLEILVSALLAPLPAGVVREHLLSASVSSEDFSALKTLQKDLGMSSVEKTLMYCINYTLAQRGIRNEKSTTKGKDHLWFL